MAVGQCQQCVHFVMTTSDGTGQCQQCVHFVMTTSDGTGQCQQCVLRIHFRRVVCALFYFFTFKKVIVV